MLRGLVFRLYHVLGRQLAQLTCMTTLITGIAMSYNIIAIGNEIWLNQSIFCDEKLSGPDLIQCSGVARRRLGLTNDIERNPDEQCKSTGVVRVSKS